MPIHPLYLIEADFGRIGRAFIETDRDQNSRKHVVGLIRTGEVKPLKVLEIIEDEGTVRDVTADILAEVDALNYTHALATTPDFVNQALFAVDHARDLRKHETL